ncbi:MAG: isoprenylcysteine carboxylmethyltransferase family protein [Pseudomonadota bacterium]
MFFDVLVCGIGWLIIGYHAWALRYHFDMPVTPPGVRVISTLVILSALTLSFLVLFYSQPLLPQVLGFAMLLFSLYLCWRTIKETADAKLLAAFDEKLPKQLLTTGPYAYVRHPFYTSYLIQWIGWAIASWSVWGLVPIVFMSTTYYLAAKGEEKKFLNTEMADAYRTYQANTGRFFPKLFK